MIFKLMEGFQTHHKKNFEKNFKAKDRKWQEMITKMLIQQGDNMSLVLFLFVIEAFVDTFRLRAQPATFAYFPESKNGKLETVKGRLINQNTMAKGTAFDLQTSFYVDDSFFVFQSRDELCNAISKLDKHFSRFGLTMHLGSDTAKSKSEVMFFPASLKQAKSLSTLLLEDIILPNDNRIHFASKFKYLGSIITPLLNEDAEIDARIKKAKSIMGLSKHFLDNKDVDCHLKYNYIHLDQ